MQEIENKNRREVWLRGALPDIIPLLQPIAHTLLQVKDEANKIMVDFPEIFLWVKPSGMASPAFHLQHITGILNRLFTYARGESLSPEQLNYLTSEGREPEQECSLEMLLNNLNQQIDEAITVLSHTSEATLTEPRGVGRMQVPSTVIGLYTHAAEHSMRHIGQLLVTVKLLKN